ncbi:uncharacterized protein [Brachyistius frenatus]|uniref:uncharacterized protein n=1 Tax=Brachyistius frenatus TaxID=100188 RepID=UPI0037E89E44
MILCYFTFVVVNGRDEGLFASCDVALMVQRGSTWRTAPGQSLTVICPVKHCGQSLTVTWCKLLNTTNCKQIIQTENVEIRQDNNLGMGESISSLSFNKISVHDDGLYRCHLMGHKKEIISHSVNISVSDTNHGVENSDNKAAESLSAAGDEAMSWLPYFTICVSLALLVVTLTALTLLRFYDWKRTMAYNHTKEKDMSTHMIPDLPKCSTPSATVLQTHFSASNSVYSPTTAETHNFPPALTPTRNQPAVANTAGGRHVSESAVYAVINHEKSGVHVRTLPTTTEQDTNQEYSVINVS